MATLSVRQKANCLGKTAPFSVKDAFFEQQTGGSLKSQLQSQTSSSREYTGDVESGWPWNNYVRAVDIEVDAYWKPASLHELVYILHHAEEKGKHVHAVGAGYSYEDLAATDEWMVDLSNLGRVLPNLVGPGHASQALTPHRRAHQLDTRSDKLVHVEAGARLFDLCKKLDEIDLAIPTLGGALGQHVGGVFSTSTHGSDIEQPPLCDLVEAVHLVTVGGREVWIESASNPVTDDDNALRQAIGGCSHLEIIRDDSLLNAVVVAMGRFGVIYSVVLRVTKAFRFGEYAVELNWRKCSQCPSSRQQKYQSLYQSGNTTGRSTGKLANSRYTY